ncbi:MAG: c-type cytochrome [Bryobacteraceae bacterium]|nr:c-type cytochrome [Bryobacteraceae bacterium]
MLNWTSHRPIRFTRQSVKLHSIAFLEGLVKAWALLVLLAAAAADLPANPNKSRKPKFSAADVAAGGRIFRSHCAECHGLTGEGGRGPDLTLGVFRHGAEDADLLATIMDGVPGTEMPGIYMEDHQAWQIVAYVRSLSARSAKRQVPGDAAAGEQVFRGRGACAQCHMVNGEGGRTGPDLSDAGGMRSAAFLRAALLEPDAYVRRAWWTYRLRTKAGEQVSGLALNQDTYSIQLLDAKGQLRSFAKSDLAGVEIDRKSPMPAYGGMLSQEEVDHVVAYLASLRRK